MKKINKSHLILCIAVSIAVLLAGCTFPHPGNTDLPMEFQVNIHLGQSGRITRNFEAFNDVERGDLDVESGQRIHIDYEAALDKGSLVLKCLDPDGAVVWEVFLPESASGSDVIISESTGRYTFTVQGQRATGHFNIAWDVG